MLRMEKGSPEEERKIQILKERIINDLPPNLLKDETLFYRFLKARDFKLDLAEAMLRKHISDRKIYNFDDMESYSLPEHLATYIPDSFLGYDKEGFIVRYFDLGNYDLKGVVTMFDFQQLVSYYISLYNIDEEKMILQSKKLGKSVCKITYIVNAENFSLFSATYKKGLEITMKGQKLLQDNFPEILKSVYIINSSFYFRIGFSVIKHIYANGLIQKIRMFEKSGWKEALLECIDADELPAFLGGNKTDTDGNPLCESFIIHGKKIPEALYKKQPKKSLSQEEGVKKLTLSRSSHVQVAIDIGQPNTLMEWEFETKIRDIGFALYYKINSEVDLLEEIIPKQRIDTALTSEVGVFKCERTGTYIMEFDNSYSWLHSKEIFYRIRLLKEKKLVS